MTIWCKKVLIDVGGGFGPPECHSVLGGSDTPTERRTLHRNWFIPMGKIKNNLKELEQSSRASSEFSPKPETEERSKTDGATVMDLSDRAETRDGVLERTAKNDSSTK